MQNMGIYYYYVNEVGESYKRWMDFSCCRCCHCACTLKTEGGYEHGQKKTVEQPSYTPLQSLSSFDDVADRVTSATSSSCPSAGTGVWGSSML